MPPNHLILCHPLLISPSIFHSIRVFSKDSVLCIRWPKYWSFSFSLSPSNEYSGLISFRMDWLDLLVVQGTLKSLFQHHSSKASILQRSTFFTVQPSHPYLTTRKTIGLTRRTFVGKVMLMQQPTTSPNVNSRPWEMMRPCRLTNCNQHPTLVGAADYGGLCTCGERGEMKTLWLSAPFCYELKLLYKPKPINKKPKTSHNRSSTASSPVHVSILLMSHPIHPLNFRFINSKLWSLESWKGPQNNLFQPHYLTDGEVKKSSFSF